MCGLAGFVSEKSLEKNEAYSNIERMCNEISHRGPDQDGYWIDNNRNIVLGHKRLSILDLSSRGSQPMTSVSGRWTIVFNGEIYNHIRIRDYLESKFKTIKWRGHSDTETLAAGFDLIGIESTLNLCVGMFAIAAWDNKNRELTLIRDRFGEKPLYYGKLNIDSNNLLLFGSDINSIKRYKNFKAKIDMQSLTEFIKFGYIGFDKSIFDEVKKVLPGEIIRYSFKEDKITKKIFWSAKEMFSRRKNKANNSQTSNYEDTKTKIKSQLIETISDQMLSDVPIGCFLSGGIDSSLVASIMQDISDKPINTFTIGFHEQNFNEAIYAKKIANHLKTNHTELYVSPKDVINIIPKISSIYSEPFADSSQLPTYLVSQLASKSVKVILSGDAGDEIFCGYNRYKIAGNFWPLINKIPFKLRKLISSNIFSISQSSWDKFNGLSKQKRLGEKMHKMALVFKNENIQSLYDDLCSQWINADQLTGVNYKKPDKISSIMKNNYSDIDFMMGMDTVTYLPDDILVKVDRASMANSLETRAPFLDHRLAELAWSLPINHLYRNNKTKAPLNDILLNYIPNILLDRPKMGFGIPIGKWLRDDLRDWVENLLDEERLKEEGFLNVKIIHQIWNEHLSKKHNHEHKLWNVLMFQSWLEENKNYIC